MIQYRLANPKDNQQLIALASATGMAGNILLRIDRKPDFFELLKRRGKSRVFIALDGDIIIGSVSASQQEVYIGGQIYPLQYIGDLKVAEKYRNKGVGLKLCDELADYVIGKNADLAFLNVSKGNQKPFSLFKNRPGIPDFDNIGSFKIYQFIGRKITRGIDELIIEKTLITEELLFFLNETYSRYELGTVVTKEKLKDADIYIVRSGDKIVAAICLADTMNVKQNIVSRVSWKKKYLLRLVNSFSGIAGISKMPLLNEPVRMMYIKYLAVNNTDKTLVRSLVNFARNIVYEKKYSFVSIGVHEKDPLNNCFSGLFRLTFESTGMLLSIKNNRDLIEKVKNGIPFEDYSIV